MGKKTISGQFVVTAITDGTSFEVDTNVGGIRFASGVASKSVALTAACRRREGDGTPAAYAAYFAVYYRTGSSYVRKYTRTSKTTAYSVTCAAVPATADAVVVFALDSAVTTATAPTAAMPPACLAKKEIPIAKDGANATMYQRRYRSTNSGEWTGTMPDLEDAPEGWGDVDVPSQVTPTARYRWMIQRTSSDGGATWGAWTAPVIDGYLAADGTSIAIKGEAVAVCQGVEEEDDVWPSPSEGDVVLYNGTYQPSIDHADWYNNGGDMEWRELPDSAVGDGWLVAGHLWMRTTVATGTGRWQDCGQIQGPPGPAGVDAEWWEIVEQDGIREVRFTEDISGTISGNPATVTLLLRHHKGDAVENLAAVPQGFAMEFLDDGGSWQTIAPGRRSTENDLSDGSYDMAVYRLRRGQQELSRWSLRSVWNKDAEWWEIVEQDGIREVRFTADYAGVVSGHPSAVTLLLRHHKGDAVENLAAVPQGFAMEYLNDGGSWETITPGRRSTENDLSDGSYDMAVYRLRQGQQELSRWSLRSVWEYQRMLIPTGVYSNREYTRTSTTTPLVLVDTGTHKGEYWFLDADTNSDGQGGYVSPNDANQSVWQRANDFEAVLTKMLFANFAQLGGFIVYVSYFFSRYGTLVAADGAETAIDNESKALTQYSGSMDGEQLRAVPYGWFTPDDPMPRGRRYDDDTFHFRPSKCINARTGEEWAAGGNVHFSSQGDVSVQGTIRATNFYHGVCIAGREQYGYCGPDFFEGRDTEEWIDNFEEGKYYDEKAALELSDGAVHVANLRPCTFDADIVIMPQMYNTSAEREVFLPAAKDFEGKAVEIVDAAYSNGQPPGNIKVRAADDGLFALGIYVKADHTWEAEPNDATLTYVIVNAGEEAGFYSINIEDRWYWLSLN